MKKFLGKKYDWYLYKKIKYNSWDSELKAI